MWNLFESLLNKGRSLSSIRGSDEPLGTLAGRRLAYLSRRKVLTLAAEFSVLEETSHATIQTLEPKAGSVGLGARSKTRTSVPNPAWPVGLAETVTKKLLDSGQISDMPDYSKRYFAGRMYMVGGILSAMDLDKRRPRAAWFVGTDGANAVMLCGADDHLRDRADTSKTDFTWYPSRIENLSLVVQSIVAYAANDTVDSGPSYLREPGRSHFQTARALMEDDLCEHSSWTPIPRGLG